MNACIRSMCFSRMRGLRVLLAVSCLLFGGTILEAQEPVRVVYLVGEKGYAILESPTFPDPTGAGRMYVRSPQAGRFIEKEEAANVLDYAYFFRIRQSTPIQAGLASLQHFDAGAEYSAAAASQLEVEQANQQARWAKVALLALTAFTWNAAQMQAQDLARNAYLPNDQARKNFRLTRLAYYGSGLTTIGYFSYVTYRAYSRSGHGADGRDLLLRERVEVPGSDVPGLQSAPDSHRLQGQVHLSLSVPVPFGFRP